VITSAASDEPENPEPLWDMTRLLDRKIASTVAPKNKINGKDD
jgi:hypothetical protein